MTHPPYPAGPADATAPGPARAAAPALAALGRVHFLGLGGVGVSGIARIMQQQGIAVSGTDAKDLPVMRELEADGATVFVGYDAANLDRAAERAGGRPVDTVVASSIAGPGNPEYDAAVERGIPVLHRSQGLAAAMAGHHVLAVAGTHGKTTTSSMAAMTFTRAGADPTFAVGAAVAGLGTNARAGAGEWFIAEADESDGTLLNYRPRVAIVTNVEADHLDFYGTAEAVVRVFRDFALLLPPDGVLVACADDAGARELAAWVRRERAAGRPAPRVATYGSDPARGDDLVIADSVPVAAAGGTGQSVTYRWAGGRSTEVELAVPGRHNALNAAAVLLAAHHAGLEPEQAARGLEAFRGTARRFEFRGEGAGVRVYDDYAHHPTEVAAAIAAARSVAGGHRVHVLFQPHLFSRTRDFAEGFAQALSGADGVRVLPVYPAREEPIDGVDSSLITRHLRTALPGSERVPADAATAVAELVAAARPGDVVLTMGAGDVTAQGGAILTALGAGEGRP
ncbi:UDP-N-acetylmuramate--L-alanine ligase [Citricoccus sp. SGAir0253]|uniref:UDP-N-acetylmuramate--L-alanine ligase n=1 Tax=Citricoccus sp. SGAir0253 TaxID=2567881 RepID=UPI0010CD4CED|nr:UDP-N-acetylmuramate--L-alanine ligase [Citricoccus sp. SGAir0253]QCU79358.1 UDP-N-acetylmuramate--L-alanine ligase [Citricoccus sp. SGAir0253]